MLSDWAFHNKQRGGKTHRYRSSDHGTVYRICDGLMVRPDSEFSNLVSGAGAPHCLRCEAVQHRYAYHEEAKP